MSLISGFGTEGGGHPLRLNEGISLGTVNQNGELSVDGVYLCPRTWRDTKGNTRDRHGFLLDDRDAGLVVTTNSIPCMPRSTTISIPKTRSHTNHLMANRSASVPKVIIVPGSSISGQPWWEELYITINTSFQIKDVAAFPPSWTRLPAGTSAGGDRLTNELGSQGWMAVMFVADQPIACAGAVPSRGDQWIRNVKSADDGTQNGQELKTQSPAQSVSGKPSTDEMALKEENWELCCVCVHPSHRKTGLSIKIIAAISEAIKPLGAKRLMTSYVIEETGSYWPHLGFKTVAGAGGILKKGFTHTRGMPGLLEDIHFAMGWKEIE